MKKIVRRILIVIPAAALQVLWLLLLVKWLAPYTALITPDHVCGGVLLCAVNIIIKREERTYKILWLLVILTFPLPGALFYLFFGNKRTAEAAGEET